MGRSLKTQQQSLHGSPGSRRESATALHGTVHSVEKAQQAKGAGSCPLTSGNRKTLQYFTPLRSLGGESRRREHPGEGAGGREVPLPPQALCGVAFSGEGQGKCVDHRCRREGEEKPPECTHLLFTPFTAVHVVTWAVKQRDKD